MSPRRVRQRVSIDYQRPGGNVPQGLEQVRARLVLRAARSPLEAPSPTYLAVRLKAGDFWEFHPRVDHDVLWIAVASGRLLTPDAVDSGELARFERTETPVVFGAVLTPSSCSGQPRRISTTWCSATIPVHTSVDSLRAGESNIDSIGAKLAQADRLPARQAVRVRWVSKL